MPTNLPRFESNERVDLADFENMVDAAPQALVRQPNEEFLTDPDAVAASKSWIIDGFAMSDLGAGQLKVTKGRAILAQREGATIHYGALTTEGDASKTLDLSGYGNDTYNIYIRFQYDDAETQSRMFWNPSGGGTEFAQTIQTRRQANWSLRVELASPGGEWVQIGTVEIVGGVIGGAGIVDQRNFYFEGSVSGAYASGWGSANDRTATRSGQYGIKDLQRFTAAVRQLFEDLRPTGGRWWEVRGLKATGKAATNEPGFDGTGDGSGAGCKGTGGATGPGLYGVGGAAGRGVIAEADTTSPAKAALLVTPQDAIPTGPNVIGDVRFDAAGKPYVCVEAGSPGKWSRFSPQAYANTVHSTQIVGDGTEQYFDVNYSIPGNWLKVGDTIRVKAIISVGDFDGAPTLRLLPKLGTQSFGDMLFNVGATTDFLIVDWTFVVRALGAVGDIAGFGQMTITDATGAVATVHGDYIIAAAIDTTSALLVQFSVIWSAAHADNKCTLHHLIVDITH